MATVAFVITELNRGGAELALLRLVRGLDRSRFTPAAVYSLDDGGAIGPLIEASGVPVVPLRMRRNPLRAMRHLIRALRDLRPAILQTFLFHANQVGRLAGLGAGIRHVISSVRVTETDRPWRPAVDRLTHAATCRITCVAEAVRDHIRRTSGIPASKLVVIPNGVDLPPRPVPSETPAGRRVLTVAHLRRQKGIDVLLRAIPTVLKACPDARFTIVGAGDPGPYRGQASSLGIGEAVRFHEPVEDVGPLLSDADLFVLPSRWEGCPNAVLEAMAAGLPVVGTAVGGTPELVSDGETGHLVPPESPSALAIRIVDLLRSPEQARALGTAGRARAAAVFPVARMIDSYESLYAACLAGSPHSASA